METKFPSEYVHPETGEILATEEEWRAALAAVEERLAPIFRLRRRLLEERAVRFEAPELPPRRGRTETQERIARCPRCGERLDSEEATRKPPPSPQSLDRSSRSV